MRRIVQITVVVISFLLILSDSVRHSTVTAQSDLAGSERTVSADRAADTALVAAIRKLTDPPVGGVRESRSAAGGTLVDLGGGLQNVMLARMNGDGDVTAACVNSVGEANAFWGRNLETGRSTARQTFGRESLKTVAARHGMSEPEFLFYSKLAAEAVGQQIVASPMLSTITIVNGDGPHEGFNDTNPKAAEGGNTGATWGAQRLNLFNHAAGIWGSFLDSAVPVKVNAQFNPIAGCTPSGGVLGSAGTRFTFHNFAGAPYPNTDYHIALANKLGGIDYTGGQDLIQTTFNTDVDSGCLGVGTRFYYGLDNTTPNGMVNLLVVLLHELGHGLGFSSLAATRSITAATNTTPIIVTTDFDHGLASGNQITVDGALGNTAANGTRTVTVLNATTFELNGSAGNGAYSVGGRVRGLYTTGRPDAWSRLLYDRTTGKYWNAMTPAERSASALNTSNLMWDGASVRLGSALLSDGRDAATGRVQMYTPAAFAGGSSVSHWDTAAAPNLLMEPSINPGLAVDLDLTKQMMRDIGWYRDGNVDNIRDTVTNVAPSGGVRIIGSSANIIWTNGGGFDKNVTIELSTDGGATYSPIATDILNSGTYSWTVPNSPTAQGRIRVREANYADPSGVSSANFAISLAPSAANAVMSGRVSSNNIGIRGALVTVIGDAGVIGTARTNAFGYYAFTELTAGQTYVVNVGHKLYSFDVRTITLHDDVTGLDFVPLGF